MRLKKLGAALVVVAALGAVLASSAFATASTEDVKWFTGSGTELTGSETMSAEAVGTGTFTTESEGGTKYVLQSKKVSCVECKIENSGGSAIGSGKLKFEEVSVVEPAGCSVASSITTTALSVTADWMEGTTNYIKFVPTKGETTAFATVSITGCALETTLVPKGSVFVQSQNATGVQAVGQEIHSSEAINATAGGSLKVGSKNASLKADAIFRMSGARSGQAFSTGGGGGGGGCSEKATVFTEPATGETTVGAILNGLVNPHGCETTINFEYKATGGSWQKVSATPSTYSGTSLEWFTAGVGGLQSGTTYTFRITATKSEPGGETVNGSERTFSTVAAPPTVFTYAASSIGSTSATLNGSVTPNGAPATYYFEYGKTKAYGTKTPENGVKSGSGELVSWGIGSLSPSTTYHFRAVGKSGGSTVPGGDETFTTAPESGPPTVITNAATGIGSSSATLNGSITPKVAGTTYWFEYGTTLGYGSKTTETAVKNEAGEAVSAVASPLSASTTYHFRLVGKAGGVTTSGLDKTFTTTASGGGGGWELQTTPNPSGALSSRLAFISCPLSGGCTSVGEYVNASGAKGPLAESWNGSSWTAQSPPNPSGGTAGELLGVSCASSSSCTAVGYANFGGAYQSLAEAWNGSTWSVQSVPSPTGTLSSELTAVSCSASNACTAVGRYTTSTLAGTLVERWNGTSWTVQASPNPVGASSSTLLGVSCTSSTACNAVGDYYSSGGERLTLAEIWNGTSWSLQTTPNRAGATGHILLGVSCTSSTACTAVGGDFPAGTPQETLVERLSGTTWSIQTSVNPSGSGASVLHGVSCTSATACVTVGDWISGGINVPLAESWNGSSWSEQATPNPSGATFGALWSVACTSATSCLAPGYYKNSSGIEFALTERAP
jgi:hypothetical protein